MDPPSGNYALDILFMPLNALRKSAMVLCLCDNANKIKPIIPPKKVTNSQNELLANN